MSFTAKVTTPGMGTTLTWGGTAIINIEDIADGGAEMGERDVTCLDSTWKEKRPTIPEGQPLKLSVRYHKADHADLWADMTNAVVRSAVVTFPMDDAATPVAGGGFTFAAFIKSMTFGGMEEDGTITADMVLTPTGAVTLN